ARPDERHFPVHLSLVHDAPQPGHCLRAVRDVRPPLEPPEAGQRNARRRLRSVRGWFQAIDAESTNRVRGRDPGLSATTKTSSRGGDATSATGFVTSRERKVLKLCRPARRFYCISIFRLRSS